VAKPTKPKTLKPKSGKEAEPGATEASSSSSSSSSSGGPGGLDLKFIIIIVVTVFSSVLGSAASLYFLGPMVFIPEIVKEVTKQLPKGAEGGEHGEKEGGHGHGDAGHHASKSLGMNLELNDFTVNLRLDPASDSSEEFLRTKMTLSIKPPEAEDCNAPPKEGEGHAPAEGGGGHGAPPPPAPGTPSPCQLAFNTKMGQFVPTVRDIINAALMKRTASMLATLEGQESLKDEIITETNNVLTPAGYTVVRVNFQDFIVQR
jgi:flagellar basal body-associated protein FliL